MSSKIFLNGKLISSEYLKIISRIKELYKKINSSKEVTAQKLGITSRMLYNYLNLKHEMPLSVVIKFAKEFEFNTMWLLTGFDDSKGYGPLPENPLPDLENRVRDEMAQYFHEDIRLNQIVEALRQDSDLMDTVWHLVKANQGIKKLKS